MSKESLIKRICCSLGENNHPTYAVMAIALFKGILRPTFTMMDKKQDPESKRYAAFREGVTEAIAFPTYFFAGKIADKLAPKFLDVLSIKDKNNPELTLTKEIRTKFDNILNIKNDVKKEKNAHDKIANIIEIRTKDAVKTLGNQEGLFNAYKKSRAVVGETTSFVGVCIAALLIIPSLCNVALPPIMKGFKKWQDSKKQNIVQPQNPNLEKITEKPVINPPNPKPNRQNAMEIYNMSKGSTGMRVGN